MDPRAPVYGRPIDRPATGGSDMPLHIETSTMPDGGTGAWPIDPDGKEGSNGGRRYDMAVLSKFEPATAFPMTAETFLERHGEKPVRMNHRTVRSVAELFEALSVDRFETKTEFHRAVGDAIRSGGGWEYGATAADQS